MKLAAGLIATIAVAQPVSQRLAAPVPGGVFTFEGSFCAGGRAEIHATARNLSGAGWKPIQFVVTAKHRGGDLTFPLSIEWIGDKGGAWVALPLPGALCSDPITITYSDGFSERDQSKINQRREEDRAAQARSERQKIEGARKAQQAETQRRQAESDAKAAERLRKAKEEAEDSRRATELAAARLEQRRQEEESARQAEIKRETEAQAKAAAKKKADEDVWLEKLIAQAKEQEKYLSQFPLIRNGTMNSLPVGADRKCAIQIADAYAAQGLEMRKRLTELGFYHCIVFSPTGTRVHPVSHSWGYTEVEFITGPHAGKRITGWVPDSWLKNEPEVLYIPPPQKKK